MRKEIYPMDYEQYIKACQTIQKTNNLLLHLFEEDLVKSGLKEKTINRHLSNVDFFLNEFLIRAGTLPMEVGISMLDEYLGNFFIRKCMWSTPANIKTNATSIKKFYKCMLEHGKIEKEDYEILSSCIKDSMESWQCDCAIYNDPDNPNPFFPF